MEKWLAADNGNGWLTLAVEYKSGANEVVDSVIT